MLRKAILAYGVLAVIGAILLAVAGIITGLVVYLFVNGAVVIAALLFERGGTGRRSVQTVHGKKQPSAPSIRRQAS